MLEKCVSILPGGRYGANAQTFIPQPGHNFAFRRATRQQCVAVLRSSLAALRVRMSQAEVQHTRTRPHTHQASFSTLRPACRCAQRHFLDKDATPEEMIKGLLDCMPMGAKKVTMIPAQAVQALADGGAPCAAMHAVAGWCGR